MFDKLKLGVFMLGYSVDKTVDTIVMTAVTNEWQEIKVSGFWITIKLTNGDVLNLWNENGKSYWLTSGVLFSKRGNYTWSECRPSAKTMVLLRDKINDWYKGENK